MQRQFFIAARSGNLARKKQNRSPIITMERTHRKTEILYQYYSIFDIVIALLSYLLISVCVADFVNFMLIVEPIYLSIFTYRVRVSNENIEIIYPFRFFSRYSNILFNNIISITVTKGKFPAYKITYKDNAQMRTKEIPLPFFSQKHAELLAFFEAKGLLDPSTPSY